MTDAARFRHEYEQCLAGAAESDSPLAKAQWLLFADKWLKLTLAEEHQQTSDSDLIPCK